MKTNCSQERNFTKKQTFRSDKRKYVFRTYRYFFRTRVCNNSFGHDKSILHNRIFQDVGQYPSMQATCSVLDENVVSVSRISSVMVVRTDLIVSEGKQPFTTTQSSSKEGGKTINFGSGNNLPGRSMKISNFTFQEREHGEEENNSTD